MIPSTIVCSGADPAPAVVVSRSMVQSVAEASVCSSWVNRFISNPAPALASIALMPSSTSSVALWARTSRRMRLATPLEPLILEGLVGAEVSYPVGDEGRIEELHRAQVHQHAAVVLAEDGDEEGRASLRRPAIDDLAGQDGLAYAWRSLDHVEATA